MDQRLKGLSMKMAEQVPKPLTFRKFSVFSLLILALGLPSQNYSTILQDFLIDISTPSAAVAGTSEYSQLQNMNFTVQPDRSIKVCYDLNGSIPLEVKLAGKVNGNDLRISYVSGDTGIVIPGKGKCIVWDVLSDYPGSLDQYDFTLGLTAEKNALLNSTTAAAAQPNALLPARSITGGSDNNALDECIKDALINNTFRDDKKHKKKRKTRKDNKTSTAGDSISSFFMEEQFKNSERMIKESKSRINTAPDEFTKKQMAIGVMKQQQSLNEAKKRLAQDQQEYRSNALSIDVLSTKVDTKKLEELQEELRIKARDYCINKINDQQQQDEEE